MCSTSIHASLLGLDHSRCFAELGNDLARKQKPDIPTPEPMEPTVKLLPNISTPWIAQDTLDRLPVSRVWLDTPDLEIEQFEDSCLFTFPSHHHSIHPASRVNQVLQYLHNP